MSLVALLVGGCATSAGSGPGTEPPRLPASRLLDASDLGPGWSAADAADTALAPCSAPAAAAAMVGPSGSTVRLAREGGTPSVVEYATSTASPRSAYVDAVRVLQTSVSCRLPGAGPARTSTFDDVLPLPPRGDASVCMVFSDSDGGTALRTGYEVVRRGRTVAVVGYTDTGSLDTTALLHVTDLALAKLTG